MLQSCFCSICKQKDKIAIFLHGSMSKKWSPYNKWIGNYLLEFSSVLLSLFCSVPEPACSVLIWAALQCACLYCCMLVCNAQERYHSVYKNRCCTAIVTQQFWEWGKWHEKILGGIIFGLRIPNGTSLWFSCVPPSHMAKIWVKIRSVSSLSMYYLYLL